MTNQVTVLQGFDVIFPCTSLNKLKRCRGTTAAGELWVRGGDTAGSPAFYSFRGVGLNGSVVSSEIQKTAVAAYDSASGSPSVGALSPCLPLFSLS